MWLFDMRALLLSLSLLAIAGPASAQQLVVIDPGHGGRDPGAVGCSLRESDVVLDVSRRLGTLLERDGVRIAFTRDTDVFIELSARAAFANSRSATGFVSVHANSNGGTPATGIETFIFRGTTNARARALGGGLQAAMVATWGLRNRGLKEAGYTVLAQTNMPAALLELGFINNCAVDAVLLGDASARQRMAEGLRVAVLEWLGVTPTTPTPTQGTGIVRGVVFQDQGVGTEDITVRLPGAQVSIVETGATMTVSGDQAAWSLSLPPGTYTVRASLSGHRTTSRRCSVSRDATTWCSVGLLPATAPVNDDEEDAGAPFDDGEDAGVPASDAEIWADAGRDIPADEPALGDEPVSAGGCSVSATGTGNGSGWLVMMGAIGMMMSWRRRRRAALAAAAMAAVCVAGCAQGGETESASGELRGAVEPGRDVGARAIVAREVPRFATLGMRHEHEAKDRFAPILSPDGSHVLLATAGHGGLVVLDLSGEAPARELCHDGRCGWEPQWQDDGAAVAFRTEGQSATAVPAEAVSLVDGAAVAVNVGERGVHAWTDEDDRAWLRIDGRIREIGPRGERILTPTLTSDRRHVVMWGMTQGVLVHRVRDGALVRVGQGSHPRVDPSGRWLVFERTVDGDDDHEIVASDLWILDLADPSYAHAPLVTSEDRVERMPSLSRIGADGAGTLAFLEGDALVTVEVRLAR